MASSVLCDDVDIDSAISTNVAAVTTTTSDGTSSLSTSDTMPVSLRSSISIDPVSTSNIEESSIPKRGRSNTYSARPRRHSCYQDMNDYMEFKKKNLANIEEPKPMTSATEILQLRNWKLEESLNIGRTKLQEVFQEKEIVLKERQALENELHELTASLFDEANRQVQVEMAKTFETKKRYDELSDNFAALQLELRELKGLLAAQPMPDTPPNSHSRSSSGPTSIAAAIKKSFSSDKTSKPIPPSSPLSSLCDKVVFYPIPFMYLESALKHEFTDFLRMSQSDEIFSSAFAKRCMAEDVRACLYFYGVDASKLLDAIIANDFEIEDFPASGIIQRCMACHQEQEVSYRLRFGSASEESPSSGEWGYLGRDCRRRIVAVCEFFTYVRYIRQGLIRSPADEIYTEFQKLRQTMCAARFGLIERS